MPSNFKFLLSVFTDITNLCMQVCMAFTQSNLIAKKTDIVFFHVLFVQHNTFSLMTREYMLLICLIAIHDG